MATRELTAAERAVATSVFQGSLMLGRVEVSDSIGLGNRPWTSCGLWTWTLNVGPDWFAADMGTKPGGTGLLVHELTHVWQGQNGTLGFGYIFRSAASQCYALLTTLDTGKAYDVPPGLAWGDYNVEQQAAIVETWHRRGMSRDDSLYPYIRDHVLTGKA